MNFEGSPTLGTDVKRTNIEGMGEDMRYNHGSKEEHGLTIADIADGLRALLPWTAQ